MPARPSSRSPLTGRILGGRYRVGALLGAGAMGRVYRAQHVELGRACAVKVIRPPEGGDDEHEAARARFRIEALAAARLDHPNVLRVLDFGREPEDDLHYLVTEHLDGADLADVLAVEGPLPAARLARIGRGICAALQHAHDRGVIHRDLKPENVLLVKGEGDDGLPLEEVKILDFGTALIEGEDPEAAEGVVLGTPAYMSPEQSSGAAVDARTDLYALGVLLFELCTGRLPFDRSTPAALAAAHASTPPPLPRAIVPDLDLDPELERVILACLRKRPRERPRDAREVREALGAVLARLEGDAAEAEPEPARSGPRSRWPVVQRMARWAAAIAGGVAVTAAWAEIHAGADASTEPVAARAEARRLRDAAAAAPASFRLEEASVVYRDAGADAGEGARAP